MCVSSFGTIPSISIRGPFARLFPADVLASSAPPTSGKSTIFFDKQGEITVGNVDEMARVFRGGIPDFDLARYNACLSDDGARRAIQADIDLGNANGVVGTPSVYVNGRKFAGELTVERLRDFIGGIRQEDTGTFNQHADTR